MNHEKQEKMVTELEELGEKLDSKLCWGLFGISFFLLVMVISITFIIVFETVNMMAFYN